MIDMEDLAEDLSWEPVSGKSLAGAMTDGSKPLRENDDPVKMMPYASTAFGSEALPPPMPSPSTGDKATGMAPQIALPDGVPSLERWGQTMVSFGKYKNVKTYAEVAEDTDPDMCKNYCQSHFKSGLGELHEGPWTRLGEPGRGSRKPSHESVQRKVVYRSVDCQPRFQGHSCPRKGPPGMQFSGVSYQHIYIF